MPKKIQDPQKLKISQLAQKSGVTVSTIKYYLKEGLIDPPTRGKGSMSFYNQSHVDRIILIKKLQKERFFPLNAIKKVLGAQIPESLLTEKEGIEETAWEPSHTSDTIPLDAVIAKTGLTIQQIDQIENNGFIHSKTTIQGRLFETVDLDILILFKERLKAGLPFEQTLEVFSIYQKHIKQAVNEDVMLFLRYILSRDEGTEFLRHLLEGERTVSSFTSLCKIKWTRMRVEDIIRKHETIPVRIVEALNFRSLDGIAQQVNNNGTSLEFTSLMEMILSGTPLSTSEKKSDSDTVRLLVHAMLDLIEGTNQEVLASLEQIKSDDPYAPLTASLKGLAQIIKISRFSDMMQFIKEMRKSIEFFEASMIACPNPVADLFSAYCRLVGFTVRPNFFDIEKDAVATFNHITRQCNKLKKDLPKERLLLPFLNELSLKSCYFMVLMYLECDLNEDAQKALDRMLKADMDVFYTAWAQRKKQEITTF